MILFFSQNYLFTVNFFLFIACYLFLTGAMDENGMTLQAANANNGVFRECMIIENELSDMVIYNEHHNNTS